jgi:hypothetical protein
MNTSNSEKEKILFWYEDPNILLNQTYILEFIPTHLMSYNQQLNAITRSVLVLTIIIMLMTPSLRVLIISLITIGMIYLMYYFKKKESLKEGLEEQVLNDERGEPQPYSEDMLVTGEKRVATTTDPTSEINNPPLENVFSEPSSQNPFSNVLITDYQNSSEKKPAPPSYTENTQESILESAKRLVQEVNPEQPGIADKLFNDLGEKINLEQSLRPFYSNPSTTIPNDQEAFANFCYGNMTSCKEGNDFACVKNVSRYTNY